MYNSPIKLIIDEITHQIVKQQDEDIYIAVLNYIPNVDKDELIRALQYDRNQYEKGYWDGQADAKAELVRCKDCKHWRNDDGLGFCTNPDGIDNYAMYDDFCSYGERKDNDN